MTASAISVVTPTHGRAPLVDRMLRSLGTARAAFDGPSEVIVVDSSPDREGDAIREACRIYGAHYVRHDVNDVRRKRNAGILESRHDVVLFVDSDCEADGALLAEHARAHTSACGGVAGLTHFVGPENWVWRAVRETSVLDSFSQVERAEIVPWAPTCNVSYRRDVLFEIGLFYEGFPFRLGGDDVDLGLRVTDSGHAIVCNSRAVVHHTRETWSTFRLIARRQFRWGRMHLHVIERHPSRTIIDFPKAPAALLLVCAASAGAAFLGCGARAAWLPPAWATLALTLEAAFRVTAGHRPGAVLCGRVLSLVFECGTVFEALLRARSVGLYREIVYTPRPGSSSGRARAASQAWAMLLAAIALVLLALAVR